MTDLAGFQTEILRSGVSPDGLTLCNCEVKQGKIDKVGRSLSCHLSTRRDKGGN